MGDGTHAQPGGHAGGVMHGTGEDPVWSKVAAVSTPTTLLKCVKAGPSMRACRGVGLSCRVWLQPAFNSRAQGGTEQADQPSDLPAALQAAVREREH